MMRVRLSEIIGDVPRVAFERLIAIAHERSGSSDNHR